MTSAYDPDVQGLVYSGYRASLHATYLLFGIGTTAPARAWIADLASRLAYGSQKRQPCNRNVAFTARALRKLGASEDALASFGPAFQEGIHTERRALILDDVDASAPERWRWGGTKSPSEIVLLLFASSADAHAADLASEKAAAARFELQLEAELAATPLPPRGQDIHEPFGFVDGLSQPVLAGTPAAAKLSPQARRLHLIPKGEVLLGHENVYGEQTRVPWLASAQRTPRFGRNGTYLVLRQLRQDVAGFWKYFLDQAAGNLQEAERLAAKAVGRWRNGAPLSEYPTSPQGFSSATAGANDFAYRDRDPYGQGCPLGSHIRRGNPRDSQAGKPDAVLEQTNAHRILRRGRGYGHFVEDPVSPHADGHERGLLFACLNANIERQFEFVQHSWIANPNFHGLHEEGDPIMAADADPRGRFTIPGRPFRERLSALPRFVSVVGGGYFFLPGRGGLQELASLGGV